MYFDYSERFSWLLKGAMAFGACDAFGFKVYTSGVSEYSEMQQEDCPEGSLEDALNGNSSATSLKAKLVASLPKINDAPSYRAARRRLQRLGGAPMLLEELVFANLVNPDTGMLNVVEKPFNVFAHIATRKLVQHNMDSEQEALGTFASKFMICSNKPENELRWDSKEEYWVRRASMARRHRFLTTKDLHWQWFNAIAFGLVPTELGGKTPQQAVVVVEEMKAACLQYARNVGGWSENIGLYVNVFGHNNVNSLFIHILDLSEIGPSFKAQEYKCLDLDDVLKVLKEEAVTRLLPTTPANTSDLFRFKKQAGMIRKASLMGKDGATSLKDELVACVPALRDASGFREARRLLMEDFGGIETLREELVRAGFVDETTDDLTTDSQPFNVFARIVAGKTKQAGMDKEQDFLEDLQQSFVACCNLPVADAHWDSNDPKWIGKASMSKRHRFISMKKLHWQWFNPLSFGLVSREAGGVSLEEAVAQLELMKSAAMKYAKGMGWSSKIGLFFHVFGHNSVNSLHLHILDMEHLGPTFWHYEYKNCPMDCVLKVLREEIELRNRETKKETDIAQALGLMTDAARRMSNASLKSAAQEHLIASKVVELNVGGHITSVPLDTLLLTPKHSWIHRKFECLSGDTWKGYLQDANGRIMLDLPPRSFNILLDHLRLLRITPPQEILEPPLVPRELQQEVEILAQRLGLGSLLEEPQWGRCDKADMEVALQQEPRPRARVAGSGSCCFCRRRRPKEIHSA